MTKDQEEKIAKLIAEGNLEELLKEAMRDNGYKTFVDMDGVEKPL